MFAVSVEKDTNHSAKMALALRLLLAFLVIGSCIAADNIDLWPMPQSVSHGTQKLYIKKDITMSMVGSTYSDEKSITSILCFCYHTYTLTLGFLNGIFIQYSTYMLFVELNVPLFSWCSCDHVFASVL